MLTHLHLECTHGLKTLNITYLRVVLNPLILKGSCKNGHIDPRNFDNDFGIVNSFTECLKENC